MQSFRGSLILVLIVQTNGNRLGTNDVCIKPLNLFYRLRVWPTANATVLHRIGTLRHTISARRTLNAWLVDCPGRQVCSAELASIEARMVSRSKWMFKKYGSSLYTPIWAVLHKAQSCMFCCNHDLCVSLFRKQEALTCFADCYSFLCHIFFYFTCQLNNKHISFDDNKHANTIICDY